MHLDDAFDTISNMHAGEPEEFTNNSKMHAGERGDEVTVNFAMHAEDDEFRKNLSMRADEAEN